MEHGTSSAGVPIRYAVTAVIDVYHVGLATVPAPPGTALSGGLGGGVVSLSAPLTDQVLHSLGEAVRTHFLGAMTRAVAEFTFRSVARTELVFGGVAAEPARTVVDGAAAGPPSEEDQQ
jgi:hypothetical protein